MKQTIGLLPLIIPFFIFTAYLHLRFFYTGFGINIEQWIGLNELLLLFFDDLVTFIFYGTIIFTGSFVVIRFNDIVTEEQGKEPSWKIAKRKSRYNFFRFGGSLIIIGYVAYMIIVTGATSRLDKIVNGFLAVSVIASVSLVFFRNLVEQMVNKKITNYSVLLIVFCVAFLTHSLVNATKKQKEYLTSNDYAKVLLKDNRRLDSLIYIGKSENYFFLYHKKQKISFVLSKDEIEQLEICHVSNNAFRLYH